MVPNEKHKTVKDVKEIPSKFDKFFAKIIKKSNLGKDTGTSFESQESCRMRYWKTKIYLLTSLLRIQLQMQLRIYLHARQVFLMIFQFLL